MVESSMQRGQRRGDEEDEEVKVGWAGGFPYFRVSHGGDHGDGEMMMMMVSWMGICKAIGGGKEGAGGGKQGRWWRSWA